MLALGLVLLAGLVPFAGTSAYATDGHFLHGVGAINQSMGGAGFALSESLLGTYYLNPAGLTKYEGTQIEFGFELFKPERQVASSAGGFEGLTLSKSEFVPIPAMAFSTQLSDRMVFGLGGLGVGGFGVDYPVDPTNPILGPRPFGFGEIYSELSMLKFTPALAYQLTDKLSVGVAGNVDWASLSIDPMPVAAPAVDPGPDGMPFTPDDRAYYSRATASDGAFGFGFQVGATYDINPMISVAGAFTSPQWFQKFEFNSVYENPNLPSYGMPRVLQFRLDVPAIVGVGTAIRPHEDLLLAFDWKYIFYENTEGFRLETAGQPFNGHGEITGFGWNNINVLALGGQWTLNPMIQVRAGYNFTENPVPGEYSFFNVPAPAVVQHHVTLGLGLQVAQTMQAHLGYYHAFNNTTEGPFWNPLGPIAGTTVSSQMKENSIQMMFTFTPGAAGPTR